MFAVGFAPDGSQLLVLDAQTTSTETPLWSLPTLSGPPRRLGDAVVRSAAWSPKGEYWPTRRPLPDHHQSFRSWLVFLSCERGGHGSGELLVFGLGLSEYRDIRVRVLPGGKEIFVGFAAVLAVALHGVGTGKTEL